jgi:hypothetical protein
MHMRCRSTHVCIRSADASFMLSSIQPIHALPTWGAGGVYMPPRDGRELTPHLVCHTMHTSTPRPRPLAASDTSYFCATAQEQPLTQQPRSGLSSRKIQGSWSPKTALKGGKSDHQLTAGAAAAGCGPRYITQTMLGYKPHHLSTSLTPHRLLRAECLQLHMPPHHLLVNLPGTTAYHPRSTTDVDLVDQDRGRPLDHPPGVTARPTRRPSGGGARRSPRSGR